MDNQPLDSHEQQPVEQRGWLERLATPKGITLIAALTIFMIVIAAIGVWYVFKAYSLDGGQSVQIEPPQSIEDLMDLYPELAPILANSELDSVYKEFFIVYQEGGSEAAIDLARKRGMLSEGDEVRMTLELDTSESAELVAQLEARGIKVTAVSGNMIDIAIPVAVIEGAIEAGDPGSLFKGLPGLEHVVRIRLPRMGLQDEGSIEIESYEEVGVNLWHAQGFYGEGIRIGVLDMGFNGYKDLLGSDLPENVVARSFIYGREIDDTDTAHGTKCAEVIHDIAPGAELIFAAYETDVEQSQAVEWLRTQDVDIISHSAGSIYGPMDGSGFEARMVDEVVASGIFWVNSAGNSGDTHYRGVFTDSDGDGFHEFSPGDELMGFIPDGLVVMVLNWDDWSDGTQDFDLYVLDEDQNEIAVSENIQDGAGDDTAEMVRYFFEDSNVYYIVFYARHTTRPVTFDFFVYDAELEYTTLDYSITTPADAESSVAVGATFWENDEVEFYSSRGPTVDGRLKPDISAPAGVSVAVEDRPFFGTSASAPHVAGAAALVLQANPGLQPAEVASFLQSRAIDLGQSGPDYEYGYGRLWLGEPPSPDAVEPEATSTSVPSPTPTAVSEQVPLPEVTDTPTAIHKPIETPAPSSSGFGSIGVAELLLICACVALPALFALGGAGLLAGVWLYRRSRKPAQPAAARRPVQMTPAKPAGKPAQVASRLPLDGDQGVCPRCDTPHSPGARYCNACGLELQPGEQPEEAPGFCNQCGMALRPSAKFCPNCGHKR